MYLHANGMNPNVAGVKYALMERLFFLYFCSEFLFGRSSVSRVLLLLFCGVAILTTWRKIYRNPFFVTYVLFTIWSVANIMTGHAVGYSTAYRMTLTLVWNSIFIFAFSQYCGACNSPEDFFKKYKLLAVPLAVVAIVAGLIGGGGARMEALGINSNLIGMYVAYALLVHFYFWRKNISERRVVTWNKNIALLLLFSAAIILTGSRKAFMIPLIGGYLLICLHKPRKFFFYTIGMFILVAIFLFLLLNVGFLYDALGWRVEAVMLYFQGIEYEETSLETRDHFIQLAWESSQDSLIWGHGADCFRLLPGAYNTYSHCNYLEILYSLGWVGLLIYYSFIFKIINGIKKAWHNNQWAMELATMILVPFLVCDYSNVTYSGRTMLIIPAITALFFNKATNNEFIKTVD